MDGSRRGRFVARWVLLCGLGLAAGLSAGLGLAAPIQAVVGMMLVTPVVLALAGALFGAAQWLALLRNFRTGAFWVAATALGLGLGMTAGVVLVEVLGRLLSGGQVRFLALGPLGRVAGLVLIGTAAGLAVGAAQFLSLRRRQPLSKAWVLRCGLGFGLGLPVGSLTADLLLGGLQSPVSFTVFLAVGGLAIGAATVGGALRIAARLD